MGFESINREERYYCNHFFRLLCHDKDEGGTGSGLGAVLQTLGYEGAEDAETIIAAEIYTEVAVFRDVFAATPDKDALLESLYDDALPIFIDQYGGQISEPLRPEKIRSKVGMIHPSLYSDRVEEFGTEEDKLFYREFSALFRAKPDFLINWGGYSLWFEAKFWEAFSSNQLQRTRNIAQLCSMNSVENYFRRAKPQVILLGSARRHKKARQFENVRFLSWEDCRDIATRILPHGDTNYTTRAFGHMLAM